MNMLGLRDLVLIAQTPSSFHHNQNQPISSDQNQNLPLPSSSPLSVGLGIFPLITTTTHPHHQNNNDSIQDSNFWNLKMCQPQQMMNNSTTNKRVEESEDDDNGGGVYDTSGEFRVCLDCGNRAKKDCSFKRCRTCCKARGFDCNTHVKSTWIPASLRRDRVADGGGGDSDGGCSSGSKRQRILVSSSHNCNGATSHSSNSNVATIARSLSLDLTSSSHQDAGFKQSLPRYIRAPAIFKCHRVSAIGNGEDELAYLATVNISGHIFKGFLYDQGVDGKNETMPCVSELQLGNSNGSGKSNRECCSPIDVPTSAYPASAC